ncbi:hypothetical protein I3843_12G048900 [Carya illinoinensis]|uniref:Uncharacterized protein n=1 Tax=Carya illinoinensis TaxID=32201 RepID=A0A8T1NST4_CARIL|nr:uncharacterized protein LOC122289204 [Carya illinoinensis]KAG2676346.1 hypothetical protein I3760_12G048900 [Carya illinoinensis]KAG6633455.1 hypothetical protein CIPAW_12G049400 [Carya illinoinensis]KAG7952226.1 hypothetical protein I3843_12G048900 [Carya illinoinensis]
MWSSMADTYSDNIKHQMILPEKTQQNPSKFYSHFLYKALIVVVFFVILPLFPSQAPEFINQSVLTRSWELLHLIFVGIAVSYGIFSRRNDETEKENNSSKFDYASYVSRFLEVSPVFDDEVESSSGNGIDENKVQTWSSQYRRNEPVVVVAQEHSVLDEQRTTGEKPLLLPVRSLKLRMPDPGVFKSEFSGTTSGSISRSNSRPTSKRFSGNSNKSRNGELVGLDHQKLEEKLMDNVVLSSPVPWQSRSGRMETKEEVDSPTLFDLPPSMAESEFDRFQSRTTSIQMTESSRSSSNTSSLKPSLSPSLTSPRKLSPSPSFSAESQAKIAEDLVRKRGFYKSSPPPAPPPPPPPLQPLVFQSFSKRPNPRPVSDGVSLEKDSCRVNSGVEMKARRQADGLAMGKSVRKIRARGAGDFVEDAMNGDSEKSPAMEKSGRKRGSNQTSFRTEKLRHESNPLMSKQAFMEFSVEEEQASVDKVTMVSDEDTESEEDDDTGGGSFIQGEGIPSNGGVSLKNVEAASSSVSDGGRDVDRKADEFIAKFREQIRLQRINSLKRSSGQIKRNPARKG